MVRVMAVGVFDLLHAGHLHYVEQAKSLGDELVVVVAHDDTVRNQKHEPITTHELRRRMVAGLKPVDEAIVGNPPSTPIFDILDVVKPDVVALGYDQKHSIDAIRAGMQRSEERRDGLVVLARFEEVGQQLVVLDGAAAVSVDLLEDGVGVHWWRSCWLRRCV